MATKTLGTAATTTLTALQYLAGGLSMADVATIAQGIIDDGSAAIAGGVTQNAQTVATHQGSTTKGPYPGAFQNNGLLFIPNRGVLRVMPGDWVCFDSTTGWPILVSQTAAAGAGYVHS